MSLWGSLTGNTQKDAVAKGTGDALKALGSGYNTAVKNLKAGTGQLTTAYKKAAPLYDDAIDSYDPWVESGVKANQMYSDANGLNGAEARGVAQEVYNSDPMLQRIAEQNQNAVMRQLAARGTSGARSSALVTARMAMEGYGNWLARIKGQSDTGLQATSGQNQMRMGKAGFETSYGDKMAGSRADLASLAYGYNASKANLYSGKGNAMAEAANIPVNNMFSLAKLNTDMAKAAVSAGAGGGA